MYYTRSVGYIYTDNSINQCMPKACIFLFSTKGIFEII